MKISNLDKANTLIQALPFIQKYNNKVIVVKYGGNAMKSETLKEAVIKDIILMSVVGIKVILVHGGGPDINKFLKKIGKKSEFINGLRYTDKETMEIVQMVLSGKVNKELVALINQNGGNAIGLCGIDGNMISSVKKKSDVDLGFVGDILNINTQVILDALENNYISVVATVGLGVDGNIYNINADTAASEIAAKVNAEKIMLLTDVPGLLLDIEDNDTLISKLNKKELNMLIKSGVVKGGMIPKIECCIKALENGVKKAHIIDGRIPHTVLLELFSDDGVGTMIEL